MQSITKLLATVFCVFAFTANADHWPQEIMEAIDVKESAFCKFLDSYKKEMKGAKGSENKIKVRNVCKKQMVDIRALMPAGAFSDWIVKVESVKVDAALNATFRATLPCHKKFVELEISATNIVTYEQLADVGLGEYALTSW